MKCHHHQLELEIEAKVKKQYCSKVQVHINISHILKVKTLCGNLTRSIHSTINESKLCLLTDRKVTPSQQQNARLQSAKAPSRQGCLQGEVVVCDYISGGKTKPKAQRGLKQT